MNLRPSGYEPDELPDCSTPRHGPGLDWCGRFAGPVAGVKRISASKSGSGAGRRLPAMCWPRHVFARPGSDLLSHALRRSTIGAEGLHGRVRDGIGCFPLAITTRPCKHMARPTRTGTAPIGGGRRRSPVRACTRTGSAGLAKSKLARMRSPPPLRLRPKRGRRMERRSAAPAAPVCRGRPPQKEKQRFPLHVRFSAPASCRPEKEQADRAISTG